MQKTLLSLVLCCCVVFVGYTQNLESIGKEKPFSVSGGLSLNQIFYTVDGIDSRRDPYTYYASGNINFSLYGWSVPLSFSYSNQNTTFQQPFNQYSLHPTYKWITGHVGYTSMSFSPYTVNGHIFLGAGVDVAPEGKWKFSGLYGRFLKAVELDTANSSQIPSYKRMGYGFKASFADNGSTVDMTLFHAKDQTNSIAALPDSIGITPQENLVLSLGAGKTFFEHFVLKGEFATSALTKDIRSDDLEGSHPLSKTEFLFDSKVSSSYYNAYKASMTFEQDAYSLGVAYERIDPEYRTLGAYYFNNDLENITVNGATSILQGKVNIAATAGTQRDNLDRSKISTLRRFVGSVNLNYVPSEKLNVSASYSSFQTFTNIRSQFVNINQLTPYDNLDTLNFTQISRNATVTTMYAIGTNKSRRQSLNVNLSYQGTADKQGGVEQNSGSKFYNANVGYAMNLVPQNMAVTVSFNATVNDGAGFSTRTSGPIAAVNKSFFQKKVRATLSSTYNNTYNGSQKINTIMNVRLGGNVSIRKKHNINISLVAVKRDTKTETTSRSFTEFTGTVGYNYSFSIK